MKTVSPLSKKVERDKAVQKYVEENTKTPEAAKKKLMDLGIIDKDGNLTDNYK